MRSETETESRVESRETDAETDAEAQAVPAPNISSESVRPSEESVRPSDSYFEGVRKLLTDYMGEHAAEPADDVIVAKTIAAANGATVEQLFSFYRGLYNNEQSPRHANGPRGYGWFPAVTRAKFGGGRGAHEPQAREPELSSSRTGGSLQSAGSILGRFKDAT
jgi:hypothetical protein